MRAELAGKLSASSERAQDRLEDTLTDGVFSALRYLPRGVLRDWLRVALPNRWHPHLTDSSVEAAQFDFWPKLPGGAEPDVTIRVGSLLVVIEAKYESGFGRSQNGDVQLTTEWRQARHVVDGEHLEGPVVLAVTNDVVEPNEILISRAQLDLTCTGMVPEDAIVWAPWQQIATVVEGQRRRLLASGERAIIQDLFELMNERGVRFMFEGFEAADWWLLGAAADAATRRVYPTIAEFAREMQSQGQQRGLIWGGTDAGAVWYESKRMDHTHQWHRNYIQLPFLDKRFGERTKHYCSLYVLFTFDQPSVRAGWWFQPTKRDSFTPLAAPTAAWLRALSASYEIAQTEHWPGRPATLDASVLTDAWVKEKLTALSRFRIERVWDPAELSSTGPVIDTLAELSDSLLSDGSVLDGMTRDGVLDRSRAPSAITLPSGIADDVGEPAG